MKLLALKSALAGAALALASAGSLAAEFTMKLSTPTMNDVNVEWMNAFKKGVEARSNGRLVVELYPGQQLGSMARTVDGVLMGTIEAAFVSSGFLVSVDPRYQIFDAVGIFDDLKHGHSVFRDPEVAKRLETFGAAKGVQPLTTFVHSPSVVVAKRPLKGLEDLKGMKLRSHPSPMLIEPLRDLGASPIPMTLGDMLPGLQNGTIDGALTGNTILTAMKFQDTAKNVLYLPSWPAVSAAIVNKAWLAKLPPDLRTVIYEEVRKADAYAAEWGEADVTRARNLFAQQGGVNVDLSPADRKRFLAEMTRSLMPVIGKNAALKEDYRVFNAVAQKHRKAP